MNPSYTLIIAISLALTACIRQEHHLAMVQPAVVEKSTDSDTPLKIRLSAEGRDRLKIESRSFAKDKGGKQTIPVSALFYDSDGKTWIYVEIAPLMFQKAIVQVTRSQVNHVSVTTKSDPSLPIVTQGVVELIGAESGLGH